MTLYNWIFFVIRILFNLISINLTTNHWNWDFRAPFLLILVSHTNYTRPKGMYIWVYDLSYSQITLFMFWFLNIELLHLFKDTVGWSNGQKWKCMENAQKELSQSNLKWLTIVVIMTWLMLFTTIFVNTGNLRNVCFSVEIIVSYGDHSVQTSDISGVLPS